MTRRAGGLRKQFLLSEEGGVFLLGCLMLILWCAVIIVLWRFGHDLWQHVLTFGFAQFFAGRAACVAYGTQLGLPPLLNVILASYVDAMTVFIIYPLLVFGYRDVFERPFFQRHMKPVFDSAQHSLPRLAKFKVAGVFVFVWFPFWMTGVVVGSVVGYLLGLKTWVNMVTVVLGTLFATLCWVYAYDRLYAWLGEIDPGIPMVFTVFVIAGLFLMQARATRRRRRAAADEKKTGSR